MREGCTHLILCININAGDGEEHRCDGSVTFFCCHD